MSAKSAMFPRLAAFAAVAALAACSDRIVDVTVPPRVNRELPPTFAFLLSEPRPSGFGVAAATRGASTSARNGAGLVFVSVPPGAVPEGRTAAIRNLATGGSTTAEVVNGGFDPVPVVAAVGDTVEVVVTDSAGANVGRASLVVPIRRPPIVVRTVPPKRGTDVPLNALIRVVFSEPMDPRTITTTTLPLLRDGAPVAGRVAMSADGLRADFVPDAPLAPATSYTLAIDGMLSDLSGDVLGGRVTVDFTTTSTPTAAAVASVTIAPASALLPLRDSLVLHATLRDEDGNELAGRSITWTSASPAIASVAATSDSGGVDDARGMVTGVGVGSVLITATSEGVNGTATITVAPPASVGVLRVTTVTHGVDLDPNGFQVRLPGLNTDSTPVGANATTVVAVVPAGDHQVSLGDIAVSCDVTGPNPRTVTVAGSDTVTVGFDIACATAGQVAFVKDVDGDPEIFLVKVNGTGLTRLTAQPGIEHVPAWSPDGTRITFASSRDGDWEIYVMNADGSGQVRLTNSPGADYWPAFSPDGSRIAFWSARDGDWNIYVMNADGSNVVRLTSHPAVDADPTWAPGGGRIAFWSERDGNRDVYVMNADGSGTTRLTNTSEPEIHTEWSPDGTRLVFAREYCDDTSCDSDLVVLSADGSAEHRLLLPTTDYDPGWSPDSRWIVFAAHACYWCAQPVVMAMRPDGSRLVPVTSEGYMPAWRP